MLEICAKCGNYGWDKTINDGYITCPKCNHTWQYKTLPLFILSGCSGVGKTTTALYIMQKTDKIAVLDADVFVGVQNAQTLEDYKRRIDTIESISKDIIQSGKAVMWTMAGNLDMLPHSYHAQFFDSIRCLVLTVDNDALRDRMTNGREISDSDWIEGSVGYNNYLREHDTIGELKYEKLEITNKTPGEVADEVISWIDRYI